MADEARLNEILDIAEQAKNEGDTATFQKMMGLYATESGDSMGAARAYSKDAGYWNPLSDTSSRALLAGASRVVTGPGQLVTAIGEATGIAPEGVTKRYTEGVKSLEEQIAGKQMSPYEQKAADVAGLVAGMAVPSAAMKPATGVISGLVKGGAAGAAGAATNLDTQAQDAWGPIIQSALGVGIGTILGGAMAVPATMINAIKNMVNKPPTPEAAAQLAEIGKTGWWQTAVDKYFTAGQKSGRFEAEVQEARVAGTKAQDLFNEQLNDLQKRFAATTARTTGTTGKTAADIGVEVQVALNKNYAINQRIASSNYEKTVEAAKDLARQDPGYNIGLKVPNTIQAVADALPTGSAWDALMNTAPGKYAKQIRETAEALIKNNGQIGGDDLIKLHQAATRLRAGLAEAARGKKLEGAAADANPMGKTIVDAIEKDMDALDAAVAQARQTAAQNPQAAAALAANGGMPGEKFLQAWDLFKTARSNYQDFIMQQRQLDATAVSRLFKFTPDDPEKAINDLLSREPGEQYKIIQLLRNTGQTDTLQAMKQWKLQDVSRKMFNLTEQGGRSPVSVDAFIKELTNGSRIAGQELWTPAELQNIKSGLAYARMIQNRSNLQNKGTEPKRVLMAGISRATAFVVGNLYDIVASGKLEDMFFSEEGRKNLKVLATSPVGSNAYNAAAGWLAAQVPQGE